MDLKYIDLLREVGACFSVNNMLRAECYKQRMERGLSFLEFNYMIMQAYDFLYLHEHYSCNMQFGGDDQWSNMLAGTDLIRRKTGEDAYALTITLLMNSEGNKMGKTAKGAVWLDPDKTSPYEFYQYWRNIGDADVMKCLRMLTFLPIEQLDEVGKWGESRINEKKELLAGELTALVHGKDEAEKARKVAYSLFVEGAASTDMPQTTVEEEVLSEDGISLTELLVLGSLAKSRSDARRLIEQGGIRVENETVGDVNAVVNREALKMGVIVRKGKKVYRRFTL